MVLGWFGDIVGAGLGAASRVASTVSGVTGDIIIRMHAKEAIEVVLNDVDRELILAIIQSETFIKIYKKHIPGIIWTIWKRYIFTMLFLLACTATGLYVIYIYDVVRITGTIIYVAWKYAVTPKEETTVWLENPGGSIYDIIAEPMETHPTYFRGSM